ncbi:hypothetical protein DFQ14_10122 [Halopolyspora algeriensis]|uniref:Uncharacterized protein n=1 Tax=Halopolyspora algeriensis TaxID=1500506 RepID=A0A368VWV8_9ACTN|nr:hypothetical protein [Halopolyspora algeriensis]RCW46686.1 hypothetical protein DFQ14_10122 [Halopolyspora algeriensis]TQM46711.1 hypothetical protein FHU43_3832 [Halopolyspora algeriensis]
MADNDFSAQSPAPREPGTPPRDVPPSSTRAAAPVRRGGPDPITLTAGLLTLAVAVYVLVGGPWSLQWVLALGAIGIGGAMLVASLRPYRDR